MKFTRIQIARILKERGWTKKRSLWYFRRGPGKRGVSLRDAASLEMLEASENLSPKPRKRSAPKDAGIGMFDEVKVVRFDEDGRHVGPSLPVDTRTYRKNTPTARRPRWTWR